MSEEDKDFRVSGSNSISDETIRHCLLGAAAPDEQANFEELLLLNDDMEQRVRRAEFELADDFSFDRLGPEERRLFARNFLVTEERGQKLAVSQAMRRALLTKASEPTAHNEIQLEVGKEDLPPLRAGQPSWRVKIPRLFGVEQPAVSFAFALVTLILFGLFVWLFMKSQRVRQPDIVKRQEATSPRPEYAHPGSSQAPSPSAEVSDSPTPAPSALAPVARIMLQIGGRFDNQQIHFTTPPTERDIVRLEIVLTSHQPATYEAKLLNTDGDQISVASELRPVVEDEHAKVVWDVPAHLLKAGDYQVILRRVLDHQAPEIGLYSFRVR